jgi:hypothetical protein
MQLLQSYEKGDNRKENINIYWCNGAMGQRYKGLIKEIKVDRIDEQVKITERIKDSKTARPAGL